MLAKNCDVDNPNEVNEYLAAQNWSNTYKEGVVNAYVHYVRMSDLSWIACAFVNLMLFRKRKITSC